MTIPTSSPALAPGRRKYFFRLLLPVLTLLLGIPPAVADQTARINPRSVLVKSFDGWGTSLCWWAQVLGDSTNREVYADLAFKQLRLNILRYNIGGGENPAHPDWMEPRARMPGFEPRPGVWDWNADANQRWFLRAAVARGANRVLAFADSPPYWMTVSGSVTGATNGAQNNLRVDCEAAFAKYLVAAVAELTRRDGVPFNFLTPMNEPAADWWQFAGRQEGTHMSPDQQARLINRLYSLLRQSHLRTGIAATDDNNEQDAVTTMKSYPSAVRRKLAVITSHTYSANAPDDLRQLAVAAGKPLWISEYGDGGADGLAMARRIHDDIAQAHASAWIYWQFAEPDSNWGLVQYHNGEPNSAFSFNRKFYILSQFSRFIRPGDEIIDSGDGDSLAAYNRKFHRLVIVSVNDRGLPAAKCFDLAAFRLGGATVRSCRTSAHEDVADLPPPSFSQSQLTVTLPVKSVTTWVIDGATPAS